MRSGTRRINLAAMARPTQPWELKERERNGQFKRETAQEVRSVGVNARIRMGASPDAATDPLCGCIFGRLLMRAEITRQQYDAGLRWEAVVGREAKRLGVPRPHPRSPSASAVGGSSGTPEEDMTADAIDRQRREYDDVVCALNDAHGGHDMLRAMKAIILMDERGDIGALRMGLNVLGRLWG